MIVPERKRGKGGVTTRGKVTSILGERGGRINIIRRGLRL